MATNPFPSRSSFIVETTAGTPPANSAAWVSNASSIYTLGTPDVSSFVRTMLEDERSREAIFREQPMIKGIKGSTEFPLETYMHGHTDTSVADTDTIAAVALISLFENALGGLHTGATTVATALGTHSTTAIDVDETSGFPEGSWVGAPDADGIIHKRRVASRDAASGAGTLTLEDALPFTPSDGDVIRCLPVAYVDESVLESAVAGPYTTSWLLEIGRTVQRWMAIGCAVNLAGISLSRNEAARVSWNILTGSFRTPEQNTDDSLAPSWSADPVGAAGQVIGPLTEVLFSTVGATPTTCYTPNSFELTPNINRTRVEALTECTSGLPGTADYGVSAEGSPEVNMTVTPRADTFFDEFVAGTVKKIHFERKSATDGSGFSIFLPRAEYTGDPVNATANDQDAYTLSFRGLRNTAATATTQLARSPLQIVFG